VLSRPALRPTQPPIQWVPGALSPGVKLITHLQLVSRSGKKYGSIHPLPLYVFMAYCLISKAQGQLYLTFYLYWLTLGGERYCGSIPESNMDFSSLPLFSGCFWLYLTDTFFKAAGAWSIPVSYMQCQGSECLVFIFPLPHISSWCYACLVQPMRLTICRLQIQPVLDTWQVPTLVI
jgi:hypothetical protein